MTGAPGFSAAGYEELAQEPLPSRHQRRILICVGEPEAGGHPDVCAAAARWQRQYVGGVYVRVPGAPEQQRSVVARFTAAGCTLQATHFYRPADVGALASLAHQLEAVATAYPSAFPSTHGEFDSVRVAELLMVGATDVVGPYPQRHMAAARAAASFVNDRLGEAWLALPMVTRAEGTSCAAGGPHARGSHQGSHQGSRPACTPDELEDHFADTARALAAETESRLEVLDRLPTCGENVPCSAAALSE
ncbi:hypothetical protein ACIQWR_39615 [Streptomyces sp. NPDC098789]|uniref:hypothetical protein n=1 Tax=Streptomyces sp. NPDC098789 TaxID=3366098 RepID=UPI003805F2B5